MIYQKVNFDIPAATCDCHLHVLDARYATGGVAIYPGESVEDYLQVRQQLKTQRAVVVLPKPFGTDNRILEDAIDKLGKESTKGIAVVNPCVSDIELDSLNKHGVCGIRLSIHNPQNAVVQADWLQPLAERISAFGWHIQLHLSANQLIEMEEEIRELPVNIVIDHIGRVVEDDCINHQAADALYRLIDSGNVWTKLSGAYMMSNKPPYEAVGEIAKDLVRRFPERLVWGSDWPHTAKRKAPPDTVELLNLLAQWVPEEKTRNKILVENPERLYRFTNQA